MKRSAGIKLWRLLAIGGGTLVGAVLLFVAAALWQTIGEPDPGAADPATDAAQIERGRYLAQIGNCQGCHTEVGGAAYAGGRAIATPFGKIYASNLTPDVETGIGAWSRQAFWRAMHDGRSRDGRLLYPAFPYPNTSLLSREDSDALHAYLLSLQPVRQPNRGHELRFPYDTQLALASWRLLFFRGPSALPQPPASINDAAVRASWQRGAYLVNGLAHCSACHGKRNALGGSNDALRADGGLMPGEHWYAPSLFDNREAGVGDWTEQQVVELLMHGRSERGSVQGPMAEVVFNSTRHLRPADAAAMAVYLRTMAPAAAPATVAAPADEASAPSAAALGLRRRGADLYAEHCSDCHGDNGEGVAGAYPALAGNRAVLLEPAVNPVQVIVQGGFGPTTAGNPRPFGMPPYGIELSQADIAALASFIRGAWGNQAAAVTPRDVQRWLEGAAQ
ncbi:c-type cytochrome [Piscinibacter sakaiensis]|uniref:c-type cytochrome n=1 Tax=Piscinibacter sakaiensis TaxID=1547922 RepID=UPI003AAA8127